MRNISNTAKKSIEAAAISNETDRFNKITTGVIDYARQIHFVCKTPYQPFTVTYLHRKPHSNKVGALKSMKLHFGEIVPTRYELFVVVEELSKLGWLIKKKRPPYEDKYPADWTESQIQRVKNDPAVRELENALKKMYEDSGPDEYEYVFNKDHQKNNLSVKIEVMQSKKRRHK